MNSDKCTITCNNVNFSYKDKQILHNFNAEFQPGRIASFTGGNGSGKTTVLKILAGLITPLSGTVELNSIDSTHQWAKFRSAIGASIYAERSFNFRLSGYHNAEYLMALSGFSQIESKRRIERLFSTFDGTEIFKHRFGDLSLGQRRIYGLLVAVLTSNGVVLLDEPTSTLDPRNSEGVYKVLAWLRENDYTVVTTTHDAKIAQISNYVVDTGDLLA